MSKSHYRSLSAQLYKAGLHRYWADRLAEEIQSHYDEIVEDIMASGREPDAAAAVAVRDIGEPDVLISHATAQMELLRVSRRLGAWLGYQPGQTAVVTGSALDAPLSAGAYMRRLSIASVCGAAVTASLILAMQISLQFS